MRRLLALPLLALACQAPGPAGQSPAGEKSGAPDTAADTGAAEVPRGAVPLAFPLLERERFETIVGVDHDPEVQEDTALGRLTCTDKDGLGFPHCYDEHAGTDYILKGGFDAMDTDSPGIFAAADGVVVLARDGYYDRCHGSIETGDVDCDGHEMVANAVILEHETGHRTKYWHMKQGSVAVEEGQVVEAGTLLGHVGSSGRSSMPHLHLELQTAEEARIDPYAGEYSQEETWWCVQDAGDGLPGGCG